MCRAEASHQSAMRFREILSFTNGTPPDHGWFGYNPNALMLDEQIMCNEKVSLKFFGALVPVNER